jgi:ABC-type sugar transport system ATPase subunit
MAQIDIRQVRKSYGKTPTLHGVDLSFDSGEFVVILGPSGCGKSTLLRMIAGLEDITSGEIAIGGRVVNTLEPRERGCAMVFQNYALYPHMSVAGNIGYALKVAGVPKAERQRRIEETAKIVGLSDYLERKPAALSGGQRQRVAMARAIIREPQVFLFDEPLSNLDAKLRVTMRAEIRKLHQRLSATSIFVTHDQVEAMTLADRLVVMNKGKIEQIGAPNHLYHSPATRFVAGFIGSPAMNFIPCKLDAAGDALNVRLSDQIAFAVPADRVPRYRGSVGKDVTFGIRPEHLTDAKPNGSKNLALFDAGIEVVEPMGNETMVFFSVGGAEVCARTDPNAGAKVGSPMKMAAHLDHMHLIDNASGQVL